MAEFCRIAKSPAQTVAIVAARKKTGEPPGTGGFFGIQKVLRNLQCARPGVAQIVNYAIVKLAVAGLHGTNSPPRGPPQMLLASDAYSPQAAPQLRSARRRRPLRRGA